MVPSIWNFFPPQEVRRSATRISAKRGDIAFFIVLVFLVGVMGELGGLGVMGLIGLIGLIGPIRPIRLIGPID